MATIRQIRVTIRTGDRPDAGLGSGAAFLGIGGREFRLDSNIDPDFPRNSNASFALGGAPSTPQDRLLREALRQFNDPTQHFVLVTENLDFFPSISSLRSGCC